MWKFAKSMTFAFLILVIVASLAIFIIGMSSASAQSATGSAWTVVFKFKPKPLNEPAGPDIRIYIMVDAKTEGEAAINAHKAISERLTAQAADALEFLESQQKR